MKRCLSALLALVLCLSCYAALAENRETIETAAVSDAQLDAFAGRFLQEKEDWEILGYVKELVRGAGVREVRGDKGTYWEITLAGTPVLTGQSATSADGGVTVVSSLFPHYALAIPARMEGGEELRAGLRQMALILNTHTQRFISQVTETAGNAEFGQFVLDGDSFNVKIPMEMTGQEMLGLAAERISNAVRDLKAAPLFENLEGFDLSAIEQWASRIRLDGRAPEVDLVFYGMLDRRSMEADLNYATAWITDEERAVSLSGGKASGKTVLHVASGKAGSFPSAGALKEAAVNGSPDAWAVDLYLVPGEDAVGVEADVYAQGFFAVVMESVKQGEATASRVSCYGSAAEAPMVEFTAQSMPTEEELPGLDLGQRQVISLEELIREAMSEAEEKPLLTALAGDVSVFGRASVLTAAAMAMPETVSGLSLLFLRRMTRQAVPSSPEQGNGETDGETEEMTDEELETLINQMLRELDEEAVEIPPVNTVTPMERMKPARENGFSQLEDILNQMMTELDAE